MTTFAVEREDQELSDALTPVIARLHGDAHIAACELRSALAVGNGYRTPNVPHGQVRGEIAVACRKVAGEGHPAAAKLHELATGLDGKPAPEPEPAPEPAPAG